MNRHLLPSFVGLFLFSAPCIAQVPNGGFETWSDVGGYDDPNQWVSFNSISFPIGAVLTCEQGTPGAVGASYVKLTTANVPGAGIVPGTLYSSADVIGLEGFPYAVRSGSLTGQWRYAIGTGDQGIITVGMSKWNTTTLQRDIIGAGVLQATGSQANWQNFSIPINYVTAETPDSALIYIMSSSGAGVAGSTISVDDLAFGAATGMEQQDASPGFSLYPSPASDVLYITADNGATQVALVDVSGREVRTSSLNQSLATIPVSGLPAGIYVARVRFADGQMIVRPFIKD
ncbi:MAG: T9SS type A sorting domain-containing protein [Flavobacteriales bacterium]